MDRFDNKINFGTGIKPSVYTGRNPIRTYYLNILAEDDARFRNHVSVLAGRFLLLSTLVLGFLI